MGDIKLVLKKQPEKSSDEMETVLSSGRKFKARQKKKKKQKTHPSQHFSAKAFVIHNFSYPPM